MASKRNLRRKQCGDKHRFETLDGAAQEARRVANGTGGWLEAYRCPFCGGHHYGHPNARQRQSSIAKARRA